MSMCREKRLDLGRSERGTAILKTDIETPKVSAAFHTPVAIFKRYPAGALPLEARRFF
jgi:hypothetical protein